MKKILSTFALCGLVMGCGFNQPTKIVEKSVYVPFVLEKKLLKTEEVPPPPKKQDFMEQSLEVRYKLLFEYSIDLMKNAKMCSSRVDEIEKNYNSHLSRVEKMNSESKDKK